MNRFIELAENFQTGETCRQALLHRSGHIHSTYILSSGAAGGRRFVLQQVNQSVFPRPSLVEKNIADVTRHIRLKAIELGRDPSRATLTPVPTYEGYAHFLDSDGDIWRMFEYIDETETVLFAKTENQVYQAGRAIGDFLLMLADFPVDKLHEVIPGFHHTPTRMRQFRQALIEDGKKRASIVNDEIDFINRREAGISRLVDLLESGKLPLRVTHNDTKISNVLFDQDTGEALCLIDLDTVMPGTCLYDFGDAARTMTNTASEDEPLLEVVDFNLDFFTALANGFLEAADPILTETERSLLPFSAILMTLECGVRFLTDYLNGDIYFHTDHPRHNLDRARVQFRLIEKMEQNLKGMIAAVSRFNQK